MSMNVSNLFYNTSGPMDNRTLISRLISFDGDDVSTGFVDVTEIETETPELRFIRWLKTKEDAFLEKTGRCVRCQVCFVDSTGDYDNVWYIVGYDDDRADTWERVGIERLTALYVNVFEDDTDLAQELNRPDLSWRIGFFGDKVYKFDVDDELKRLKHFSEKMEDRGPVAEYVLETIKEFLLFLKGSIYDIS